MEVLVDNLLVVRFYWLKRATRGKCPQGEIHQINLTKLVKLESKILGENVKYPDVIGESYPLFHSEDLPGAKFKIGDTVILLKCFLGGYKFLGKEYTVTGVGETDENEFEYSLKNYPYLVWEKEIKNK